MKKGLCFGLILLMTLHSYFLLFAESIEIPTLSLQALSDGLIMEQVPELLVSEAPLPTSVELSGVASDLFTTSGVFVETALADDIVSALLVETGQTLFTGEAALIVSEIFFDGSDEWFEISNIGSGEFIGPLVVKGVKSSDLSLGLIHIPVGSTFVWGDTMAQFIDRGVVQGSSLGLSISDTNALAVGLYSSGQLLDTFSVEASILSVLPNNYGFEKIWSGGAVAVSSTNTGRVTNISGTWIANPGQIMTYQPMPPLPSASETTPPLTGNILTGDNISTGEASFNSGIIISEIHPTNDTLPEYMELFFVSSFSGSLIIQGIGSSSTAKTVHLNVRAGQYVVFADSLSGFVDPSMVLLTDSVSLTDGGESLVVTDAFGSVYANVHYTGSASGRSWYMSGSEPIQKDFPTPGFSEKALAYFSAYSSSSLATKTSVDNSYYQGLYKKRKDRYYDLKDQISAFGLAVNKGGIAYKKTNAGEIELVDGAEEFNGEVVSGLSNQVRIVAVMADGDGKDEHNEQVTVELVSGGPIDISSFLIRVGSKKTMLGGLLQMPGDKQTVKGTFGFTNKPTCITLEHNAIVQDTFCYGQPEAGVWIGLTGNIASDNTLSGITDFSRMKQLRLAVQTGQVCAFFGETPFSCQDLSPALDAKKQASYQKKIDSLQKKFDKKTSQYKTLQERYKKTKETLEAKWRKYYQQVKSVRSDYKTKLSASQLETKIWKSYDKIVQNYLRENWAMVRQNPDIVALQELLDANIKAMNSLSGGKNLSLEGYSFAIGDLKKQFAFKTDPSVFIDYFVGKGLALFSGELSNKRNKWVDQWYAKDEQ